MTLAGAASAATLVDSNVLLDVLTRDPQWFGWSASALAERADAGRLVINPVIVSEIAHNFDDLDDLDQALPAAEFIRVDLPWAAAFLAGRAHVTYRQRGGARARTLPDFLIGAHAAVSGLVLLTRDARRYATYFPSVAVLSPSTTTT